LPEAHNDFIAAIIGEELGFVGIVGLCGLYLLIVARGVRMALRAKDDYGSYIAFGISTMFGVQALVNLSVALAVLPTKGLTLPFVSYGGSSLLVNAVAAGILLNISRHIPPDPSAEDKLRAADTPVPAAVVNEDGLSLAIIDPGPQGTAADAVTESAQ
jgi:cell division protein FtsW